MLFSPLRGLYRVLGASGAEKLQRTFVDAAISATITHRS